MATWTHYFTFKAKDEFEGHWVEVVADSVKKAENLMEEMYGRTWDKRYADFGYFPHRNYPNGCLAHYEID